MNLILARLLGQTQQSKPTPKSLGSGMAAKAGLDLQLQPIHQQLQMKAAMGEGPDPGPYEQWRDMMIQQGGLLNAVNTQ